MAHRIVLTERQRATLFDLPTNEAALLRHYTLADDDIEFIQTRRRAHNRFGFALQLCVLRFPGRLLASGEVIPQEVSRFLAAQLGLKSDDLMRYAAREETRHEHLAALRNIYGYKMFSGRGARDLKTWLEGEAETARSSEDLVKRFIGECRRAQTILPSISTIERLCADGLVAAERRVETRIVDHLNYVMKDQLDALLTENVDGRFSRFIWLRQFEVGKNSADINRLLGRLEFLQGVDLPVDVLDGVPPHRIARLRRQGERYFTDGLRDISSDRRLAILAVCAMEWRVTIADAVVETHDRVVGKIWRDAKKLCDAQINDAKTSLQETLRSFKAHFSTRPDLGVVICGTVAFSALQFALAAGPREVALAGIDLTNFDEPRINETKDSRACTGLDESVPRMLSHFRLAADCAKLGGVRLKTLSQPSRLPEVGFDFHSALNSE